MPVAGQYGRQRKQTGGSSFSDDTWPSRGASEPASTTHPPPTIHPRTYPIQEFSNAAVHRAIHLTGGQQPIRWLQSSRAGRDLQLFTIPRRAGGQPSRPREGDFHAPPSPRWGTDARSFAGTSWGFCADGTWRHREAAGGRVDLGSRSFFGGGVITKILSKDPFGHHFHDVSVLYNKDVHGFRLPIPAAIGIDYSVRHLASCESNLSPYLSFKGISQTCETQLNILTKRA